MQEEGKRLGVEKTIAFILDSQKNFSICDRGDARAAVIRRPFVEGPGVKFFDLLDRFATFLVTIVRWVCIVLASALFIIVVVAVVARYGFGQAVSWTEEVPRYLLIWISFLAAAVGVFHRDHVGFDVLFNALPRPVRRVLGVALSALILDVSVGSCFATASPSYRTSAAI